MNLSRTALAVLGGWALASCNLALGFSGYDFDGKGGASSSGGLDGGGGDPGPDAHTDASPDADAGPGPGHTLWSLSFGDMSDQTVNAVAIGPNDHIFLTGRANTLQSFGCPADAGVGAGPGYLVELSSGGDCLWSFFFGDMDAEGTGVAVDASGNVVLSGTFRGNLPLPATAQTTAATISADAVGDQDSFIMGFDAGHAPKWVHHVGGNTMGGDQVITAVARTGDEIVAVGYFDTDLFISSPPGGPGANPIASSSDGKDAFEIVFDGAGNFITSILVFSQTTGQDQVASGVAVNGQDLFAVAGVTTGQTNIDMLPAIQVPSIQSAFLSVYDKNKVSHLARVFGGSDTQKGRRVAFNPSGALFLAGEMRGDLFLGASADAGPMLGNTGGFEVFLARFEPAAKGASAAILLGAPTGLVSVNGLSTDGSTVVLAGAFSGTQLGFAGSPLTVDALSASGDVYVTRVDSMLAAPLWLRRFGDASGKQGADAVALDSVGHTVVAGHFTMGLDFGDGQKPLLSSGQGDIFVAKLAH